MPPIALRLLKIYTANDLVASFGKDWKDFKIYQGRLVCDMWPDGITPAQLRKLFHLAKQSPYLETEAEIQKNARKALEVRCQELERDNRFFRDLMRQENARQKLQGGVC